MALYNLMRQVHCNEALFANELRMLVEHWQGWSPEEILAHHFYYSEAVAMWSRLWFHLENIFRRQDNSDFLFDKHIFERAQSLIYNFLSNMYRFKINLKKRGRVIAAARRAFRLHYPVYGTSLPQNRCYAT
jgi:hypothetical protein